MRNGDPDRHPRAARASAGSPRADRPGAGGPGPRSRALLARLARVENPGVTAIGPRFPVVWERAHGTRVWDADGNEYLDLTAAFGVAAVGHAHPRVTAAIARQAVLLPHAMGDVHPARLKVELLERLAALAPGDLNVTHLGLSGSDALEAALKTAVLATGRSGVLAFAGAYHGLSYGALPLAGTEYFRTPFAAQLARHVHHAPFAGPGSAEFSSIESILAAGGIGAVVIEPVQGRGGVRPAPPDLLPALATLCRRHGVLLIIDEIMTGLGRTGRWFAVEDETVVPDILLVGKALGGGLPLSAAIGSEGVMASWRGAAGSGGGIAPAHGGRIATAHGGGTPAGPALHTATFLGHPLAAAAALAVLDVIAEEDLVARAALHGRTLREGLAAALAADAGVAAVRGRGLMIGVELRDPQTGAPDGARAAGVMVELCARGVLVLTAGAAGEVIELTPPLIITAVEIERAIAALAAALAAVPAGGQDAGWSKRP